MSYEPPYSLTPLIVQHVAEIVELVTRWRVSGGETLTPQLRRENRIRTIQASLAIEQNTLSVEQVSAVLDGKHVVGLPHEIQEVRNAFTAYEQLASWNPHSSTDLCAAHGVLMAGLVDEAGHYRKGGVGIYSQDELVHMAPPADRVYGLMADLLDWLASAAVHPLIASCVFHYEFEFIHPFADGNGRMGRLWQTLILSRWQPVLVYLPVETVIKARQADYYQVLAQADNAGDSTVFIEFMLHALLDALTEALAKTAEKASEKMSGKTSEKIITALQGNPSFTIAELAKTLGVSNRTIERNLQKLQQKGRLRRIGPAKGGHWEILP